MSKTGLVMDDVFQRHDAGASHPETPRRLARIADELTRLTLHEQCHIMAPERIKPEIVLRTHTDAYVRRLTDACKNGEPYIDTPDSAICRETFNIASLAAGSVLGAVDAVMSKEIANAFCAVRPPGHHAERDRSMGFCMFANVAIAVDHLRHEHGIDRVLILDFDVHHGNGTQHILEEDPTAMFISIHGHPDFLYPGTGYAEERGRGAGDGSTLNVPMQPHSNDGDYRVAFDKHIRKVLDKFEPEFVLVSAGFDAHRSDPLATLDLATESFGWMTDLLLDCADQHCSGRLVSVLEGGYDLHALAESVALHLERLIARSAKHAHA